MQTATVPPVRERTAQCLYCAETFPRWQRKHRDDDPPVSGLRLRNAHALSVHAWMVGA